MPSDGIDVSLGEISVHAVFLRFSPFEEVFRYLFEHGIGKHVLFLFVIAHFDNFFLYFFVFGLQIVRGAIGNSPGVAENLIPEERTLGVRIPDHEFCQGLLRRFGRPIVSTSANITGEPTPKRLPEIAREIVDGVDYVVNPRFEGRPTGKPSSIIAFTEDGGVKVIRQ